MGLKKPEDAFLACQDLANFIGSQSKRICELEEGSCRFRCRSMRQAFNAGWQSAVDLVEPCTTWEARDIEISYKQWLKEQREEEGKQER